MRTPLSCTVITPLFILAAAVIFVDCAKKQDDTQPPATAATPTAYPGYPPQAGYPQPQGTYAQPYPGQYPAPTATYGQAAPPPMTAAPAPVPPAAPAAGPAASGQMAVPGPIAFTCQNDVPCGTHHCNVQYGKCAFPCQSAADCISPNTCMAGLCVPAPPH